MSQKLPCGGEFDTSFLDSRSRRYDPNRFHQESFRLSLNELACVQIGKKQFEHCHPVVSTTSHAPTLDGIFPNCFQNNLAQRFQLAFSCGEQLHEVMKKNAFKKKYTKDQVDVTNKEDASIAANGQILEKDNNCTTSMYKRNPPLANDHHAAIERRKIIKSYKRHLHINLDLLDQRDEIPLRRDTFSPRHGMEDDDVTINTDNLSRHPQQNYDSQSYDYQSSPDRSTTPSYRKKLHQRRGWKTTTLHSNASSLDLTLPGISGTPLRNRQRLSAASKFTSADMTNYQSSPTKGRYIHEREHEAPFSDDTSMFREAVQSKTPQSKKHANPTTSSIRSSSKISGHTNSRHYNSEKNIGNHNNVSIKYHDASSIHETNEIDNLMYY